MTIGAGCARAAIFLFALALSPGPRTVAAADTVTVVFAGDTSFGENYQDAIATAGGGNARVERGYDHAIAELGPLLERADLAIVNLETPLTERRVSPLLGKLFVHYGDPRQTTAALARYGVDAVSLANNHTLDLGLDGLLDTFDALDDSGIARFGAGDGESVASAPFIRRSGEGDDAITVAVLGAFVRDPTYERWAVYADGPLPGVAALDLPGIRVQLAELRRREPAAFVVVFPHWGYDRWWRDPEQVEVAHALIDAGADMVIGHGGHTMQEVERYRGKWIVYGLGDFVFNAPSTYDDPDVTPFSLIAELEIAPGQPPTLAGLRLYPILSDNAATGYRPRLLDAAEFSEAAARLLDRSPLGNDMARFSAAADTFGRFIQVEAGSDDEP